MTLRFGSRFVSLVLLAPFVALAACAPAPAKLLLSLEDQRYLEIMVAPPIPCSDLKIDVVNSYAGCKRFGGMMAGDTFTKYQSPVDDAALMTAVDVRCYDLRPERIRFYEVCNPIVAVNQSNSIPKIVNPELPVPKLPAPSVLTVGNTSGTASTFVFKSDLITSLSAKAGDTESYASRETLSNGDTLQIAGKTVVRKDKDGVVKEIYALE
jgi:hypothetical protein